jgi:hypothetical protein
VTGRERCHLGRLFGQSSGEWENSSRTPCFTGFRACFKPPQHQPPMPPEQQRMGRGLKTIQKIAVFFSLSTRMRWDVSRNRGLDTNTTSSLRITAFPAVPSLAGRRKVKGKVNLPLALDSVVPCVSDRHRTLVLCGRGCGLGGRGRLERVGGGCNMCSGCEVGG